MNIHQIATSQSDSRPGTDYPARHTSSLDPVKGNPVHPTTGKPIFETDLDADFGESSRPWRKPGADITDYFNYGFDEFTWASYCLKKQSMPKEVGTISAQTQQMMQMVMSDAQPNLNPMNPMAAMQGMMPPMGPAGSGPNGMPGMPQQMMDWMKANGMDPSKMPLDQPPAGMMPGLPNMQQNSGIPSGPAAAAFAGGHHDNFSGGGGGGGGNRGRGRRGRGNW